MNNSVIEILAILIVLILFGCSVALVVYIFKKFLTTSALDDSKTNYQKGVNLAFTESDMILGRKKMPPILAGLRAGGLIIFSILFLVILAELYFSNNLTPDLVLKAIAVFAITVSAILVFVKSKK